MSRPSVNDYMDYEEPDPVWFPGVGEKARIVGDWSMGFGQVGEVIRIEPYRDSDGAIDGAEIIIRLDDGSEDSYDFEDLLHPDEAWEPEEEDENDIEPLSVEEVEAIEAEYQATRFDDMDE